MNKGDKVIIREYGHLLEKGERIHLDGRVGKLSRELKLWEYESFRFLTGHTAWWVDLDGINWVIPSVCIYPYSSESGPFQNGAKATLVNQSRLIKVGIGHQGKSVTLVRKLTQDEVKNRPMLHGEESWWVTIGASHAEWYVPVSCLEIANKPSTENLKPEQTTINQNKKEQNNMYVQIRYSKKTIVTGEGSLPQVVEQPLVPMQEVFCPTEKAGIAMASAKPDVAKAINELQPTDTLIVLASIVG